MARKKAQKRSAPDDKNGANDDCSASKSTDNEDKIKDEALSKKMKKGSGVIEAQKTLKLAIEHW